MMTTALRRFWPTIVGAIILVGIAAALWWAGLARPPAHVAVTVAAAPPAAEPVREYLDFAGRLSSDSVSDGAVIGGLRKLAGALGSVAATPPEAAVDLRVAAEHIVLNPDSVETTDAVRRSLLATADCLDDAGTGAPLLRPLAESIDQGKPLRDQQEELMKFFVRAAERIREESRPNASTRSTR